MTTGQAMPAQRVRALVQPFDFTARQQARVSNDDAQTLRREAAEVITLAVDALLSDSHLLPPGLAATLRAYRGQLLRHCARQPWARSGGRTRYGRLADTLARHITEGTWKPGQRMPSTRCLATTYEETEKTVRQALFLLAVRGHLAQDRHSYYVLPCFPGLANEIDQRERDNS
jgi:hypothetical protein